MEIAYKPLNSVAVIRWPIDGFTQQLSSHKDLTSKYFSLKGLSSEDFYLRVHFDKYVHYYFIVDYMDMESEVEFTVRFWLENIDGEKLVESDLKTAKVTEDEQDVRCCSEVMNHDELFSRASFFKSDKAIVCCEIAYKIPDNIANHFNSDVKFRQKLWNSHANGFHDAVTIKVEGKEFKLSKAVLTANSQIFTCMFQNTNCIEAQTGVIEIKDIKASVIKGLIQFMYLGKIDNLGPIAIDLFKAVDKYEIWDLIGLCAEEMVKNLSGETLFDVIVIAYSYKCDILISAISKFLVANSNAGHFTKMISSGQWIQFAGKHEKMAGEIIKDMFENMKISC